MAYRYDVEKEPGLVHDTHHQYDGTPAYGGLEKRNGSYVDQEGAVPGEAFEIGDTMYAKLQRLAGKLKIEQRGIERVPEDERTDQGFRALLNVSTMVCR